MKLDNDNCLISIIVPMYNVATSIERCIKSLLNQTYDCIEIILIDDGSIDGTVSVCEKMKKNNDNIILVSIENAGVSNARNVGINISKGRYILFVDSDDYVATDYVEKMVKNQKENFVTICGYNKINKVNQKSMGRVVYEQENQVSIVMKEDFDKIYKTTFSSAVWNKMYDKTIIDENNIVFPKDLSLGEDLLFNLKYFEKVNGFILLNDALYNYVIDSNGLNYKYRENAFEIYEDLYSNILNFAKKCQVNENGKLTLRKLMIKDSYTALWGYMRNSRENYIKKRRIVKQKMKSDLFKEVIRDVLLSEEIPFLYRVILKSKSVFLFKIYTKISSF